MRGHYETKDIQIAFCFVLFHMCQKRCDESLSHCKRSRFCQRCRVCDFHFSCTALRSPMHHTAVQPAALQGPRYRFISEVWCALWWAHEVILSSNSMLNCHDSSNVNASNTTCRDLWKYRYPFTRSTLQVRSSNTLKLMCFEKLCYKSPPERKLFILFLRP